MAVRHGSVNRRLQLQAAALAGRSWGWQEDAACRTEPVDLFFGPDRETPSQRRAREHAAAQVCATCPVLEACRQHAVSLPETYGVWGGLTENQRASSGRDTTTAVA